MAVLIEALSVVVRRDSVATRFPGGWKGFVTACPCEQYCYDDELCRVSFMHPADAQAFTEKLKSSGLNSSDAGGSLDFVLVDQVEGERGSECVWVECYQADAPGGQVLVCRLRGSRTSSFVTPDGWTYETSLYGQYQRTGGRPGAAALEYVGVEDGLQVYRHKETGKKYFVGRSMLNAEDSAEELWRRGVEASARQDWRQAVSDLGRVAQLSPNDPEVALAFGMALRRDSQGEAIQSLRRATVLDPQLGGAWHELGVALGEQGEVDEGVLCLERAAELQPEEPNVWADFGVVLRLAGRLADAIASCRRALALAPGDELAAETLGYVLLETEEAELALEVFSRVSTETEATGLALGLPISMQLSGDLQGAEDAYRRVTRRFPNCAEGWAAFGDCLNKQQRHRDAEQACRRATELDASSAMAWSNLGDAMEGLRNIVRARQCWLRALELQPGLEDAMAGLRRSE